MGLIRVTCPECGGSGYLDYGEEEDELCWNCGGYGYIDEEE